VCFTRCRFRLCLSRRCSVEESIRKSASWLCGTIKRKINPGTSLFTSTFAFMYSRRELARLRHTKHKCEIKYILYRDSRYNCNLHRSPANSITVIVLSRSIRGKSYIPAIARYFIRHSRQKSHCTLSIRIKYF